ncbi:Fic family protein [Alkalimonas sp.]|uniref:Fic/DOC family protein n=1 Tax=Alkalimonas sp. TaxID=1872453 RepID=UPI00263AB208|nr:Fic family protein [Alkalimonas sp.]MCC5827544.1 Fic family protein [Alkalimonas sp.]
MTRYEIDSSETQYQPGSNNTVLRNKLGIVLADEMDDIEVILLMQLYEKVFSPEASESLIFSFEDISAWHRQWLGNVYEWAGKIRNVDMGKAGFQFASALQISRCLDVFEADYLSQFDRLPNLTKEELVSYVARSHVEFILIHPFREGNGRISRLLIDYMCHKAGLGLLDYSLWDKQKDFYIKSIQAGIACDYQHMERLVRGII